MYRGDELAGPNNTSAALVQCDLHTHTSYSGDCATSLDQFLYICRLRGLDRVAVTDHNTVEGALALKRMDPDRIVVGEEVRTSCGELLALFIEERVPPDRPPEETVEQIRQQGGIVGISHPLDGLRREALRRAELPRVLDLVDFVEVFNARCMFQRYNRAALALAIERDLLMTSGSDAHSSWELGRGVTLMPPFDSPSSFLESLRVARIRGRISPPWVHLLSRYAKLSRVLGLRPLPQAATDGTTHGGSLRGLEDSASE